MRAWTFTFRGSPSEVLRLRHDLPQPQASLLKHDEVIVQISHASLFGPNARLMAVFPHFTSEPYIPEIEFSGKVTALGNGNDRSIQVEDAVFGMIDPKIYHKYNGVLAEFIVLPRRCIARMPTNMSYAEAAGLSGGGITAIGIAERAGLLSIVPSQNGIETVSRAAGKSILVTGGATGTGMAMVQVMAHLVGKTGKIVATASPRSTSLVMELGAKEVIDYTKHKQLHTYLAGKYGAQPFDAIVDIAGSDDLLYSQSPAYLKPDGCFVFAGKISTTHARPASSSLDAFLFFLNLLRLPLSWILTTIWPVLLGGVPRRGFFHSGTPTARHLEVSRQIAEQGHLKVVVDSVWDMDDVLEAYKHIDGPISGKVVVKVEQ